jgi:hypothetical protein
MAASDDDLAALLGLAPALPGGVRQRLLSRVAASARASRAFVTVRRAGAPGEHLAPGVVGRALYAAAAAPARAAEPARVRLLELAPGAAWQRPGDGWRCEWLLMQGAAVLNTQPLAPRDYHFAPAGRAALLRGDARGALVYLREAPADHGDAVLTRLDAETPWDDFAPGIRRRVLWSRGGEASMLYCAQAGAGVPRHHHGRDEECLMLEGEVFLDDVLLRGGDYQLAPAGSAHDGVFAASGAVLFAHGDLDLDIAPAA